MEVAAQTIPINLFAHLDKQVHVDEWTYIHVLSITCCGVWEIVTVENLLHIIKVAFDIVDLCTNRLWRIDEAKSLILGSCGKSGICIEAFVFFE